VFERRLKILLVISGIAVCVLIARLFQLQIVRADYYRAQAELSLLLQPVPLPFVRGSILDRTGEVLAQDDACWDVTVDYNVIACAAERSTKPIMRSLRKWRRARVEPFANAVDDAELESFFASEMIAMWTDLTRLTLDRDPVSISALQERVRDIHERVSGVRRIVARHRGFDSPVAEEVQTHPLLTDLDPSKQIEARERLARYPWVHVEPSSRRVYGGDATSLAHVLGRLGPVNPEAVQSDPNADDPFAGYQGNERLGISGVEYAAEKMLRGRRGRLVRDQRGEIVESDFIGAVNGQDVVITLHAELQSRLFHLLGETVAATPYSTGGAIVVLQVPSREVLALVSYPSFDPNRFNEEYAALRDDTVGLPLWPRAISSGYSPGSTIKPLVCLAGLMNGVITLDTREHCDGYLFDDVRDSWRCWEVHGTGVRKAHGDVDVVEALTGSCNIFMFRLGERLGVDRLCNVFDMAGVGRESGLGLPGEVVGINPTPAWLMQHKGMTVTPGTARQFSIGQAEVQMTPIQIANLMATYATGTYRPVTLVRKETETPVWTLPIDRSALLAIQRAMYGVVNDPDGTAQKYVDFQSDRFALCGKTGSATVAPRAIAYNVTFIDKQNQTHTIRVPAGSRADALSRFAATYPGATVQPESVEVAESWPTQPPEDGNRHAHAWFGGFPQPLDETGRPDWSKTPPMAFAVLIEFGGSGGRVSGPLGQHVAETMIEVLGPQLDPDAQPIAEDGT